MNVLIRSSFVKLHFLKPSAVLLLSLSLVSCTSLFGVPVMGTVENGRYLDVDGAYSCPLTVDSLLELEGMPEIVDAIRQVETEHIPLSQRAPGDPKNNRVVSNEIKSAVSHRFTYPSGTEVEIVNGRTTGMTERDLRYGMTGGFTKEFNRERLSFDDGLLQINLMLLPWFEEGASYMGVSPREAYRQGQGQDPVLKIQANLLLAQANHHITIDVPANRYISHGVGPRDLEAIYSDVTANASLQAQLLDAAVRWLQQCEFAESLDASNVGTID